MARSRVTLDVPAILGSEGVQKAIEDAATSIIKQANRNTTAPIGITWRRVDDETVRIGPRGAAAIPVEWAPRHVPARRPVKRALDAHEVR